MARILSTLAAEREPRRSDIIRSVVRALSILELLARFPRGLTAKEVSARVHLHLSTTYHLLNTLVETGYIVKDPDSQLFRISGKIGYTTYGTASPAQIVRHLSPHVRSLQEDTQETAYLSLWDGNNIVLSAIVESPLSVRVKVLTVGYSEGNHAMALGKAILAQKSSAAGSDLFHSGIGKSGALECGDVSPLSKAASRCRTPKDARRARERHKTLSSIVHRPWSLVYIPPSPNLPPNLMQS